MNNTIKYDIKNLVISASDSHSGIDKYCVLVKNTKETNPTSSECTEWKTFSGQATSHQLTFNPQIWYYRGDRLNYYIYVFVKDKVGNETYAETELHRINLMGNKICISNKTYDFMWCENYSCKAGIREGDTYGDSIEFAYKTNFKFGECKNTYTPPADKTPTKVEEDKLTNTSPEQYTKRYANENWVVYKTDQYIMQGDGSGITNLVNSSWLKSGTTLFNNIVNNYVVGQLDGNTEVYINENEKSYSTYGTQFFIIYVKDNQINKTAYPAACAATKTLSKCSAGSVTINGSTYYKIYVVSYDKQWSLCLSRGGC